MCSRTGARWGGWALGWLARLRRGLCVCCALRFDCPQRPGFRMQDVRRNQEDYDFRPAPRRGRVNQVCRCRICPPMRQGHEREVFCRAQVGSRDVGRQVAPLSGCLPAPVATRAWAQARARARFAACVRGVLRRTADVALIARHALRRRCAGDGPCARALPPRRRLGHTNYKIEESELEREERLKKWETDLG